MASTKVASFNLKISVDGKEQVVIASANVDNLKKSVDKAGSALARFGNISLGIQGLSNAIGKIQGSFENVTSENRTFTEAMAAANTMAGKSGKDFDKMKSSVAELAKEIPIARDQLANGLYQVISNGVPEDNWINYLKESARASVGGIADLGETVKVTSTVIKNYGLEWSAASEVQDKIQLTAKNGVTSFEQLAHSLPMVTGNAATLGVTIDELMASFATLTGVSGNTAEVATQISAVFTSLVKPSAEATKMADQMGIRFDAAAIKAAGGMRNFITQLDADVRKYANKSGMLEQEIYGRLFGSAMAMRALIPLTGELADKFADNVDAMKGSAGTIEEAFGTMSDTTTSKFQKFKNIIAGSTDGITSALSSLPPYLNMVAQVGEGVVAITAVVQALKTFRAAQLATAAASGLASVAMKASALALGVYKTAVTWASAATTAFGVAMRTALITSGIGAVLVGLGFAFSALAGKISSAVNSGEKLTESQQRAKESTEQMKKAIGDVRSEMDTNITKLKEFKGTKAEERKLVEQMNSTYGNAMGYYSSVAQWYTALVGNSKQYCDQMVREIQMRKLANDVAEIRQQEENILYDDNGKAKRYSKKNERVLISNPGMVGGSMNQVNYEYKEVEGTSDHAKATRQYKELLLRRKAAEKKLQKLAGTSSGYYKKFEGWQEAPPETTGAKSKSIETSNKAKSSVKRPKTTVEKWGDEIAELQRQKENATTIKAKVEIEDKITAIQAKINEATKGKLTIEAEVEPTYIVAGSSEDKRKSRSNAEGRASRIMQDYEVGIINREQAEADIRAINDKLATLGVKSVEVHFKTHTEELQDELQKAQNAIAEAKGEGSKIAAAINVKEIQAQIDRETRGQLTIEADAELQYIAKGSKEDKRRSHGNADQNAQRIQQDYEIGIIGKDEALADIANINAALAELGLKPIKIPLQTDDADKAKEKMQGACDAISAMGSSLSSLGNAIELPELNVAGVLAQSIATIIQGYSLATTQAAALGPWAWIAFAAAGLGQLAAVISSVKQMSAYATGGVVGGTSTHGDRKFARVNSGEMILNKTQQGRLFGIVEGRYTPPSFQDKRPQPIIVSAQPMQQHLQSPVINITMNAKTRKMLEVLSDDKRISAKSGRHYFD